MTSPRLAVTFEAQDPVRVARFWAELLDREQVASGPVVLLPGSATQVGLRIVPGGRQTAGANRLHLHLTSARPKDQGRTVARALELGGRHVDVGQLPEEGHIVLGDPEGNEFCVIEAGNGFLAGCGFLGEVACDGLRRTGLFWSEVLGWPLVWDQDEETAVQSPEGGTKVAWGGPPLAPRAGRDRQRLHLTLDGDPSTHIDRLVALGGDPARGPPGRRPAGRPGRQRVRGRRHRVIGGVVHRDVSVRSLPWVPDDLVRAETCWRSAPDGGRSPGGRSRRVLLPAAGRRLGGDPAPGPPGHHPAR